MKDTVQIYPFFTMIMNREVNIPINELFFVLNFVAHFCGLSCVS